MRAGNLIWARKCLQERKGKVLKILLSYLLILRRKSIGKAQTLEEKKRYVQFDFKKYLRLDFSERKLVFS